MHYFSSVLKWYFGCESYQEYVLTVTILFWLPYESEVNNSLNKSLYSGVMRPYN